MTIFTKMFRQDRLSPNKRLNDLRILNGKQDPDRCYHDIARLSTDRAIYNGPAHQSTAESRSCAPPHIKTLLRRACYDCHSNETQWPWYTYIAPVSWLVERDVEGGRRQLNFSEWGSYYPTTRKRKLQWMERTLHEETMPPWHYRILHPGASLTPQDLAELEKWMESEIAEQPQKSSENKYGEF